MKWLAPCLLLGGCLLLGTAPELPCSEEPDTCVPYACGADGACETRCSEDTDCVEGTICDIGDCVAPCMPRSCPDGLACDESFNQCRTSCFLDTHCRGARVCCTSTAWLDDECAEMNTCYQP